MMNPGSNSSLRLVPSVNLFLSTRSMCLGAKRSGEDHLTEFIAAALADSPKFRDSYLKLTVSERFGGAVLAGIQTQVPYGKFGAPDLQLLLKDLNGNEFKVLVEHKIDAAEGKREIEDDERQFNGQLDGYLHIPGVAALLYFRRSEKSPSQKVLDNQKYVRPATLSHFLWESLYEVLKQCEGESYLVACLREGFEDLGFLPPPKSLGDLYHPEKTQRDRNRNSLYNHLAPVRAELQELGWTSIERDQQGNEMRCEGNNKSSAFRITVTGSQKDGRFTIRIVPKFETEPDLAEMKALFEKVYANEPAFRRVKQIQGQRNGVNNVPCLLVEFTSLTTILQRWSEDNISDRLMSLIFPIAEAIPLMRNGIKKQRVAP